MTSKIVVNNIEADSGISTVTFNSNISGNLIGNVTGNVNSTGVTTVTTLRATSIVGVTTAGITTVYTSSINQGPVSGLRNLIYNGEVMIDQRGSASSPITFADAVYSADRWRSQLSGSVTATFGQSGVGTTTGDGSFQKSLLVTCTTSSTPSAGHHASVGQRLERTDVSNLGWGTSSAIPVTLSFYVRSSKTGTYSVGILGGDGANYTYVFEYTIPSANTWQKVTKTITGSTIGTWTPGTSTGLYLNFMLNNGGSGSAGTLSTLDTWTAGNYYAGSPNNVNFFDTNGATFYLTGVQLERGTVATPFERRSYGQELALAQRYCWVFSAADSQYANLGWGLSNPSTSNFASVVIPLPVQMRTKPTSVTVSSQSHFSMTDFNSSYAWSSVALNSVNSTPNLLHMEGAMAAGSTQNRFYVPRAENSTSARLTVSSEL